MGIGAVEEEEEGVEHGVNPRGDRLVTTPRLDLDVRLTKVVLELVARRRSVPSSALETEAFEEEIQSQPLTGRRSGRAGGGDAAGHLRGEPSGRRRCGRSPVMTWTGAASWWRLCAGGVATTRSVHLRGRPGGVGCH